MELFRALGVLCEPPTAAHRRLAGLLDLPAVAREDEYADVFLFRLYPYASVYLSPDGKLGGEARDRIAGFWRALGLAPPAEPDHLAALLGLYASLVEQERAETERAHRLLLREARRALLHEHLLSWTEPYLVKLGEVAPPAYRAWGALLDEALAAEAAELGSPAGPPAALREAPALEPPAAIGGGAFLEQLLAPVRTGVILVSDDLAAAARQLGLGLRIAERRYVLEALLAQDAAGMLGWLAEHAATWSSRHESEFWSERAAAAAALLADTATEAAGKEIEHAR
jgi:TorA maturation chaperone TorD